MAKKNKVKISSDTPLITPKSNISISVNDSSGKAKDVTVSTSSSLISGINVDHFRKPNYYKYLPIRDKLIDMLDGTNTTSQVIDNLHISYATFWKY